MSSYGHLLRALVERGPRFLWLYFREALLFDLVHGTNTHMRREKQPVGHEEFRDGLLYVASLTGTVKKTLRAVEDLLGPAFSEYQFVDLGSGKGKTLLVYAVEYAKRGPPQAVGIEYSEALCGVARENLSRMAIPPERAVVVCDSAVNVLQYCGADRRLIIYLYNSFQGQTLREVLRRLAGVPHVLIYVDPVERSALDSAGYSVLMFEQGRYHATTWLLATKGLEETQEDAAVSALASVRT